MVDLRARNLANFIVPLIKIAFFVREVSAVSFLGFTTLEQANSGASVEGMSDKVTELNVTECLIRSLKLTWGAYSLIWVIRVRAAGKGMVFLGLAVLNRVYNLTCLCPKQL